MDDFIAALPKAELHLHLEGSIEPETLHELDPSRSYEGLYQYADFDAFLKTFGVVGKLLRGPDDYALIARRLLARLHAHNVTDAEMIAPAGAGLWKQRG